MFDKKRCMNNIYAIAREKGIKIGELEKAANLSVGYLSKLSKEGNNAVPGIEGLLLIADYLGVSIDFLVSADYKELNRDEKYYIAFIEKLIRGIESGKLSWTIESALYLNSNNTGSGFVHPLFLPIPSLVEHPETGDLVDYVANVYQSRFLRVNDINYFENSYHCELDENGNLLYMMRLDVGEKNYPKKELTFEQLTDENYTHPKHKEVELYIVDSSGQVNPLCSTYYAGTEMRRVIEKLYVAVSEGNRMLNMSSDVKSIIDNIMNLNW